MPAAQTITTAQQLWEAGDIGPCELVRGELVMMTPASDEHGDITNEIAYRLTHYVKAKGLGKVYAADTGFYLDVNPDTVRAPDVAFIRKERVPKKHSREFSRVMPDLVVEVISPHDRHSEVVDKVGQWLDAGCPVVWVVDPPSRTVHVYRTDRNVRVLGDKDRLTGDDVVPGFSLAVSEIFPD